MRSRSAATIRARTTCSCSVETSSRPSRSRTTARSWSSPGRCSPSSRRRPSSSTALRSTRSSFSRSRASPRSAWATSSASAKEGLTKRGEALGPRWTPRCCVLSRTDSYGYRHSLRPCLGTTSTPRGRAALRQTLLGGPAPAAPARICARRLAEGPGGRLEVGALQACQLLGVGVLQRGREPHGLVVQRLLEHRPRVARVAEPLAARSVLEDPPQRLDGALGQAVLVLEGEALGDRHQLVGRVVLEGELTREARAQAGVRVEELVHQARVPGDDHDQAVTVILHPLEQCLDGLLAE